VAGVPEGIIGGNIMVAVEKKINKLKEQVKILEEKIRIAEEELAGIIELDLVLPEDDIDGLHFNETKVHAVFELKDGWYYSKDILFLSVRNNKEDNNKDILTKYITDIERLDYVVTIREQIAERMGVEFYELEVSLPRDNQGIKKYNGVSCGYWLHPKCTGFANSFTLVNYYGLEDGLNASSVGGCVLAFHC
jgi:hypothetical protein